VNKIKTITMAVVILIVSAVTNSAQISDSDYEILSYTATINDGKALEKNLLFKSEENIIANVTLRDGKAMGVHTEKNAFWVLGAAGRGKLVLGDNDKTIELKPGAMVLVKAGIPHDVIAEPELSILIVKFLKKENNDAD